MRLDFRSPVNLDQNVDTNKEQTGMRSFSLFRCLVNLFQSQYDTKDSTTVCVLSLQLVSDEPSFCFVLFTKKLRPPEYTLLT